MPSTVLQFRKRRPGFGATSAGVPIWVPLVLVLLAIVSFASYLRVEGSKVGLAEVDPTRFDIRAVDTPILPSWEDRLAAILASEGSVSVHDREAIEALATRVGALSFVADVGEPEVVWPDGLSLPVRFHIPSANVKVGDVYLAVAEDGTVLSGVSSLPHEARGVPLPVLGPLDGALDRLRPGDVLVDDRHRDALAVALSLAKNLNLAERSALGRLLIDASRKQAWDGKPGGVVLDLDDRRRVWFGRTPRSLEPGELAAPVKWRHVADAVQRLMSGEDWAVLDARWDSPDFYQREQRPELEQGR